MNDKLHFFSWSTKIFFLFLFLSSFNVKAQSCLYSDIQKSILPSNHLKNGNVLRIPVVVHIVLPYYSKVHISDNIIIQQIKSLNRDFRKRNSNWKLLSQKYRELSTDTRIEFFLACQEIDYKPVRAITRTETSIENIGLTNALFVTDEGGADAWSTSEFLNIWVCDMPEELLGFGSSPEDAGRYNDGVVINYRYFGNIGKTLQHNMGRTLVHEVGHYLGLSHPWGNIRDECIEDDGIIDTPMQKGPHSGCPVTENNMCSGDEKFYGNFMDYSYDCCLAMFTKQQAEIMRGSLLTFRSELPTGEGDCNTLVSNSMVINLYPNPAFSVCTISWPESTNMSEISIYNSKGQLLDNLKPTISFNQVDLCLEKYPKGVLFFQLIDLEDKEYIKSLIYR